MDIKEIINQRYAMPDASLDRLQQCLTEVSYPKGFRVLYGAQNEAYKSRSAEKWVRGLCFNELGVCG